MRHMHLNNYSGLNISLKSFIFGNIMIFFLVREAIHTSLLMDSRNVAFLLSVQVGSGKHAYSRLESVNLCA